MKKFIILLILVLVSIVLIGCTNPIQKETDASSVVLDFELPAALPLLNTAETVMTRVIVPIAKSAVVYILDESDGIAFTQNADLLETENGFRGKVKFPSVPVGAFTVKIEIVEHHGVVIYSARDSLTVSNNTTTEKSLKVVPHSASAENLFFDNGISSFDISASEYTLLKIDTELSGEDIWINFPDLSDDQYSWIKNQIFLQAPDGSAMHSRVVDELVDTFVISLPEKDSTDEAVDTPIAFLWIWNNSESILSVSIGKSDSEVGNYISSTIGRLVYVPAGSFQRDEDPENISAITKPFRMSEHQITQSQFEAIMGVNPSYFSDDDEAPNRPVERVNWYDAIAFANKLSIAEGFTPVYSVAGVDFDALAYDEIPTDSNDDWDAAETNWDADGYRLPTEVEWMWAAMGADKDSYGDPMQDGINRTGYSKPFAGYDGSNSIDDYAWYFRNSGDEYLSGDHDWNVIMENNGRTHPVGNKLPNEIGLYDMSGNVKEWIWDWSRFHSSHDDPESRRIISGGDCHSEASSCTVVSQLDRYPQESRLYYGFRLVRP